MADSEDVSSTAALFNMAAITTAYTFLVVPSMSAVISLIYYKELKIRRIIALAALAYAFPVFVWTTYVWLPKIDDAVDNYISTSSFHAPDEDMKAFRGAVASMSSSTRIVNATTLAAGHLCLAFAAWCIVVRWLPSRRSALVPNTLHHALLLLYITPFLASSYFLTGIATYCAVRGHAPLKLLRALVEMLQRAESWICILNAGAVNLGLLASLFRDRKSKVQVNSRSRAARLLTYCIALFSIGNIIDSVVTRLALSHDVEMTPVRMFVKVVWMYVSYNVSIFCELVFVMFVLTARRNQSQSDEEGNVPQGQGSAEGTPRDGRDAEVAWKAEVLKIDSEVLGRIVEVVEVKEGAK